MIEVNLPTLFVVALVAAIGAFFGSYLREKGKNLATHEDLDRVVRKTADIPFPAPENVAAKRCASEKRAF